MYTLATCLLALSIKAQTITPVCFKPAVNYTAGTQPFALTSADFNGDGKKDLAVANFNSKNVSVFLGTGTGTFGVHTNFIVDSLPESITSADFNRDGHIDLAIANDATNNISILLGNGSGSFGVATNFTVSANPRCVISADFNGDTIPDLAVAAAGANKVSILFGSGNGSFVASSNYSVGTFPESITCADFNNDGKLDLATANYSSNNISILLGSSVGLFSVQSTFSGGLKPISIVHADFNLDGNMDLATANYSSGGNNITVFYGNGLANFNTNTSFAPAGTNPNSIINADFNNDGFVDLAVANKTSNDVAIVLNDGTGNFLTTSNYTVGTSPWSITSADFNGDGKVDLATANALSSNASVLLNSQLIISITAATPILCRNNTTTLTASGANTYTWSGGITGNGSSQVITPTGINSSSYIISYTVDGTNTNGCKNTAIATITVNPLPTVIATINTATVCLGNVDTLTASGATTYTWSSNASNAHTNTVSITPSVNTTYTVTGRDTNGCINIAMVSVSTQSCTTTGINQFTNSRGQLLIYPNPVNSILNLELKMQNEVPQIQVVDMLGNILIKNEELKMQNGSFQIDVSNLQSGVYFVRVGNATTKFIKE